MSNPYFNDEQNAHMDYLHSLAAAKCCWCGWHEAGKCQSCPPAVTLADRIKAECPRCHNFPHAPGATMVHIRGCPEAKPITTPDPAK